jgi:predicted nucleic acid-binding protein
LVALLANDDAQHTRCAEQSKVLATPFLTTWPVLTEAAWLLRDKAESIPKLLGLLEDGLVQCIELDAEAGQAISQLATTYADMRPQLADLTLVYIASRENISTVFSLDRRDFSIYRDHRGQPFRLIP